MNATPTSGGTTDTGELVLSLTDVAHMFNAPGIDPLSPSPTEALGTSGVEYLLELLNADKQRQRARTLVLLMPPDKALPTLTEPTSRSLRRHVEWRLEQLLLELRNTYRYGWKVAGLAIVILAICLGLSSIFASDITEGMRPLVRTTFEYGFEIIGWVILWHPIEVLAFAPLAIRSRITALRALARMDVVVRAGPR